MNTPPLAERMRPNKLDELAGQPQLTGKGSILRTAIENGKIPSMILWGPPGVGKTTIAHIIAQTLHQPFYQLSAISAGVKEVREIIEEAKTKTGAILFIDEIHRFNKGQQDALLGAVEKGIITLIGATTENPSFEVNSALLSRCQVYILQSLGKAELVHLLEHAINDDVILKEKNIVLKETEAIIRISGGDARKLLNLLELVVDAASPNPSGGGVYEGSKNFNAPDNLETSQIPPFGGGGALITDDMVMEIAQQRIALYDKKGEQHYDIISAFIKSMRGSDPNGAVYWLARMIEAGEDVKFIARRMLIFASEDIGNANPNALLLATSTFQAVNMIGYPESRIILSQCAIYLATSAKSNAAYLAINDALEAVKKQGDLPVPLHLRNAPTKLMKQMDYGKNYQYAHNFENNFVLQQFLPSELEGRVFYSPQKNAREDELRKFLKERWKEKYRY
jgi:putative ATPase